MANNNQIGDSELILTDNTRIYHLDLRPDQIGDTIITVGDPDRVKIVSGILEKKGELIHAVQHREFVTHTVKLEGGKLISVISTGIGPDNIDIVLNELDALVNIDLETRLVKRERRSLNIIRLGTSGGLQPDLPAGKVVVSAKAIGLDNLIHFYKYQHSTEDKAMLDDLTRHADLSESSIRPYVVSASSALAQRFNTDFFHHGITVTAPGFYAPQGRWLSGDLSHPHLVDSLMEFEHSGYRVSNMEMETSAILGLGGLLGHNCLSISVNINNRRTKEFAKDLHGIIIEMIEKSVDIITTL